jgi:hypothetical protein
MVRIFKSECCNKCYKNRKALGTHMKFRAKKCKVCMHCAHDFGSAQKQRNHLTEERCPVLHNAKVAERAAKRAAKRVAGKKTGFHNSVLSTVSGLTTKVQKLTALCDRLNQQLFCLTARCYDYDNLHTRIRGDLKAHGLSISYVGYRQQAIEKHFERTPLKFQTMFERIQDLEVTLDKRKKREKAQFPDYDKPIRVDPAPGKNGPEHCWRGVSLGEIEKELREDLASVMGATLDTNEKRHYRTRIRRRVNILNK